MLVAPLEELFNKLLVANKQGGEFAAPTPCLRMVAVSSFLAHNDRPDRVQFTMLTEQMLAAQMPRMYIPNPHTF